MLKLDMFKRGSVGPVVCLLLLNRVAESVGGVEFAPITG